MTNQSYSSSSCISSRLNRSVSRSCIANTLPKFTSSASSFIPVHRMLRSRVQKSILLTLLLIVGSLTDLAASSPVTKQEQQQQQQQQIKSQTQTKIQVQQQSMVRVLQCRDGCYEKFATKDTLCQQNPECLMCSDECAKPPPPKINKSIRETWSLHTVTMLQQDSLVLVDVAWAPLSTTPNQCLVTWEVSGGGLMGNLLTESFNVQLSLWPDTKYRVQVTCKNKLTGHMSRSLPLTIDTAEAIAPQENVDQQLLSQHEPAAPALPPAVAGTSSQSTVPILQQKNSKINEIVNSISSDIDREEDDDIAVNIDSSEAQSQLPNAPILPYDDQSAETINHHTNFIFNWHTRNSDISAIEPLQKPDLNILTIAALSDVQKPLLFGVIAGSLLLTFILLLYVCLLRQQRVPNDKMALIEDDTHSVVVSMPPNPTPSAAASPAMGNYCNNAPHCSRNALKV